MEIPRHITVLRDGPCAPEASVLCMFLALLGAECHQHDLAEALADAPADSLLGLASHLSRSPLVIALSNAAAPPAQMAILVNRLRCDNHLNWDGAFLAVVGRHEDRAELLKIDLLGDAQNRFSFGGIQGHAALFRPVRIAELLRQLADLKELGAHAWAALLDQANARKVSMMTKEAERLIAAGDLPAAAAAVGNLISLVERIVWLPLMRDWHQDNRLVKEFLSDYRDAEVGTYELAPVIQRVRQILSKTYIGDD